MEDKRREEEEEEEEIDRELEGKVSLKNYMEGERNKVGGWVGLCIGEEGF